MFNFMRFGEKGNSIVFDLTHQEKKDLKNGVVTMDALYDRVMVNPVKHVLDVKERGLEKLLAITGMVDGNLDLSNGAGKSTTLEAMCYTRYEKIVRRTAQNPDKIEKAGLSIVTKIDGKYPTGLKESWVEELCEIGGKIYRIRRGREFTRNQKSHTPIMELECLYEGSTDSMMSHRTGDTKSNLDEILTMDYDLYVNSQMFGQNDAGKYLTGTDKTKKEMLIALLRLENIVSGCLENVRKKKSAQEKKIEKIKSAVDLYEKAFCVKYGLLTGKKIESFDPDLNMASEILRILEETKVKYKEDIQVFAEKIKQIEDQIGVLSKSEKIQKTETIKEEGRKLSQEKKAKEQAMTDQVAEWRKLSTEASQSIYKKTEQIIAAEKKTDRLVASKSETEKIINQFDLSKHQEQLQRVEKAKKFKPQFLDSLVEARGVLEKASNDRAVIISRNKDLESDLKKLSVHDKNTSFVCPECKSNVTKEHISSAIETINKTIQDNKASLDGFDAILSDKKKIVADLEAKMVKVNDLLISEAKVNSAIKSFEDAKIKIVDIESQIKENNESIDGLNKEKVDLEKKMVEYTVRIAEIQKSFEAEILDLKASIDKLVRQLKDAENEANAITTQIQDLRRQKTDLEGQKSKTAESYGSVVKDRENFDNQRLELENKHKERETESKYLNRILFLEDIYGLDGIQTRIVKKYLPLLNVYIKEYLDVLSDGIMGVKMVINDKQKIDMIISGGTADSYEMLSGGEKMIVRLAVDIGLSLLAFSRTTQKPELICLDEVFGSLDVGRTKNVFKVLDKLSDKFSRIILISHSAEINSQIKTKVIIEKGGGRMGLSEIKRIE